MLVLGCCMLGGLAGMNMQVVTGFNIQAEHHYPHMVLQPLGLLLLLTAGAMLARPVSGGCAGRGGGVWGGLPGLLRSAGGGGGELGRDAPDAGGGPGFVCLAGGA